MQLPVFTEPFQLYKPDRLDIDDFIFGFVIDGAAVDGFRGFVDKFNVQHVRVDLADTVALPVAREAVQKNGDIRFHVRSDQAQFIMLENTEGFIARQCALRGLAKL